METTASRNSYQIVVKPVEFSITCTYSGKTVDVSNFNGYVERTVAIPDGIDPSRITTGIVLNADGTFSHVPTAIIVIGGKYYAKINSLTNSTYSVIWNPVQFADVSNSWARDAINNMGSRLIVTGIGSNNFAPGRDITRAEFAAILVRALGLRPGTGTNSFNDVKADNWFSGYVETAVQYSIVTGFGDGTFRPGESITREQAMVMIARAMAITELDPALSGSEAVALLSGFTDAPETSGYAESGIAACLKTGVVNGKDGLIAPKDDITRAEAAVMVQRLLQKSGLI